MVVPAYLRPFAAVMALLLTLTALPSCDKDVVIKTIDVRLVTHLTMDVKAGDPLSGSFTQVLDPDSNSDVRDNRSKIKKVVIDRLSYRVIDFDGATGITGGGTWKIYASDAPSEVTTLTTVAGLDFAALQTASTEQVLAVSDEAKAKLVDMINNRKKIVFLLEGNVSAKPAKARFEVYVFTKIDVGV